MSTQESITNHLTAVVMERMQRRYARLVGRGTTALYVALRAIALTHGLGAAIVPDVICSTVLDAVLLAGFRPLFADVTPDRFGLDSAAAAHLIAHNAAVRAVIAGHIFGYASAMPPLAVPIIEDAVQGLGGNVNGRPIGTLGAISI